MLKISFIEPEIRKLNTFLLGEMFIGNDYETFAAELGFWDKKDYERHWNRSLQAISKRDLTVICTSVNNESADVWGVVCRADSCKVYNSVVSAKSLRWKEWLVDTDYSGRFFLNMTSDDASEWEFTLPITE